MWLLLVLATLLLPTLCLSAALNKKGPARWQNATISCVTKTDENSSSVTCVFGFNVAQQKYDFNVITIDPANNTNTKVVLMCNWIIEGHPPECKIAEGYRFDNTNINDKTTLFVPPEILNSGYKFQCQISPLDPNRPSQPCDKNTTCKEGVQSNTTITAPATTTTDRADSSASVQTALIVVIAVAVILVIALIVLSVKYCRSRQPGTSPANQQSTVQSNGHGPPATTTTGGNQSNDQASEPFLNGSCQA